VQQEVREVIAKRVATPDLVSMLGEPVSGQYNFAIGLVNMTRTFSNVRARMAALRVMWLVSSHSTNCPCSPRMVSDQRQREDK